MTKHETHRYLLLADGAAKDAVELVKQLCVGNEIHTVVVLHLTKELGDGLVNALGLSVAKKLLSNKPVEFFGAEMTLKTKRTVGISFRADIVLAFCGEKTIVDIIDDAYTSFVVCAPIVKGCVEVEQWRRTWNPEVPGEPRCPTEKLIGNTVAQALTDADAGLTNKMDRKFVFEILQDLHSKGEKYDPDDLRCWAVRDKWSTSEADALREIAKKVLAGKRA
jgi:hypothetical protein